MSGIVRACSTLFRARNAGTADVSSQHTQRLREEGFCVVEGVLDAATVRDVRRRLVAAAEESRRRGIDTFMPVLDPNDRNVRVFNRRDLDPVFVELIQHPRGIELVRELLGDAFLISNFTANIALPGSRSMNLHSDQAIVIPEPWFDALLKSELGRSTSSGVSTT